MPKESGQKSELINLINPKFRKILSNDIPARSGSVGGFIQNKPIVCGGKDDVWNYFQDCLVITDSFRSFNMREKRAQAASVVIDEDKLLVIGGSGGFHSNDAKTSMEIVTLDQPPVQGPYLPFTIAEHGMVQYNSSMIFIIGGFQNGNKSERTWIMNPEKRFHVREGPAMNIGRAVHGCGKMKVNGKYFIVVVGGSGVFDNCLDSVEFLDPTSDQGWIWGELFGIDEI